MSSTHYNVHRLAGRLVYHSHTVYRLAGMLVYNSHIVYRLVGRLVYHSHTVYRLVGRLVYYHSHTVLVLPRYKKMCITILVDLQLFITIISRYIIINK